MNRRETRRFVSWLDKHDPDEGYVYLNTTGCPIARYIAERMKLPEVSVGSTTWRKIGDPETHPFPYEWNMFVVDVRTYGDAAARGKAYLSSWIKRSAR